jgi:hypothetical protein
MKYGVDIGDMFDVEDIANKYWMCGVIGQRCNIQFHCPRPANSIPNRLRHAEAFVTQHRENTGSDQVATCNDWVPKINIS